jgi:predicted carbohydrate-binding protein with CBM5 and CBM33 domain
MPIRSRHIWGSSIFGLFATVHGHGFISSPAPRMPGSAFGSACGGQLLSQQTSDRYGNVQGEMQVLGSDFDAAACNLWLCKGYKFADNAANVHSFTAGETVPVEVEIRAPHTGTANVSIIDTASNTVIGSPLISWDEYAANSSPIPADQTSFDITIPSDLAGQCSERGACVIQWFWDARSIDQTYEACIDFTVSGSGDDSGSSPLPTSSSSGSATSVATTSSVFEASSVSASQAAPTTTAPAGTMTASPTGANFTLTGEPTSPTFTTRLPGVDAVYKCVAEV